MAEVVERYLEEVYEECSALYKAELFSLDEIRKFVKTRRGLLYKTERKEKRPMDYMALINLDLKYHALLSLRRKEKGFYFNKSLEKKAMQRISRLYKVMCFRFQDRVPFWLSHVAFLRRLGRYKAVDRELARMLQMHGDKADLWAMTARWHFHERAEVRMRVRQRAVQEKKALKANAKAKAKKEEQEKGEDDDEVEEMEEDLKEEESERAVRLGTIEDGIKIARETLHAGIKQNTTNADLLQHYFAFELDVADWNRWRRSQGLTNPKMPTATQDSVCSGELVGIVWETIRSKWPNSLPVVSACVDLINRVGWPKAEGAAWVQDLLELHRTLATQQSSAAPLGGASSVLSAQAAGSTPESQVTEFETALMDGGSDAGRAVFWRVARSGLASVPLLQRFVVLEEAQATVPVADLRKAFDLVACGAGLRSKDFWLAFVAFEERHDPLKASAVDWRARKALPDKELNAFSIERLAPKLLS